MMQRNKSDMLCFAPFIWHCALPQWVSQSVEKASDLHVCLRTLKAPLCRLLLTAVSKQPRGWKRKWSDLVISSKDEMPQRSFFVFVFRNAQADVFFFFSSPALCSFLLFCLYTSHLLLSFTSLSPLFLSSVFMLLKLILSSYIFLNSNDHHREEITAKGTDKSAMLG